MVTIKDVAEISGYSVATISAVINNKPIVSEEAKIKILKVIKEMNYRPNNIARSLKNTKTNSIAILLRDISNPFYSLIASGVENVAWSNGYSVFICNIEGDIEKEESYIESLLDKQVDGILIATSLTKRPPYYDKIKNNKTPFIFINRKPDNLESDESFVGSDNFDAAVLGVDYLYKKGFKKISYLSGPATLSTFKERKLGFLAEMERKACSIIPELMYEGLDTMANAIAYTEHLLSTKNLPDAFFCSSDTFAFGLYQALNKAGIQVPEDIAILSIDNSIISPLINLTSIDLQSEIMGKEACQLLIKIISGEDKIKKNILLKPTIVVRKTC